ncbi:terminase small subunit [Vibrio phage K469]
MKYSKIACYGAFARKPKIPFTPPAVEGHPQCFYMKGTNGSGKSTIASEMRARDPDAYYVVVMGRKLLTVFPNFNTLAVGKYDNSNSKGCDSLKDTEEMLWAVTVSEESEFAGMHMIFDGIIPASILATWVERLRERDRELVVAFLSTPFETCLERIRARNKGKVLDDHLVSLVKRKYDRIVGFRSRHADLFPDVKACIIDGQATIEHMLVSFLNRKMESL